MRTNFHDLWKVQQEQFPGSEHISYTRLLFALSDKKYAHPEEEKYQAASRWVHECANRWSRGEVHNNSFFYTTKNGSIGFRTGMAPEDYSSGCLLKWEEII